MMNDWKQLELVFLDLMLYKHMKKVHFERYINCNGWNLLFILHTDRNFTKQLASNQFRAQQDNFFFELDGEMDSEEDLSRSKRYFGSRFMHYH